MTRPLFTALLISLFIAYLQSTYAAETTACTSPYENAKSSVFTIFSVNEENEKQSSLGCAVAISEHLLATNYHVALSGNYLVVEVNGKSHLGRIFYYNQNKDLCIIEVVGTVLKPATIRPSKTVPMGEEVFAIGNPCGIEKTVSKGIISNEKIENGKLTRLQTNALLAPGSSGGGLFDKDGKLIGITFGGDPNDRKIGFALPTEYILNVVKPKNQSGSETKNNQSYTEYTTTSVTDNSQTVKQNNNPVIAQNTSTSETDPNKINQINYHGKSKIGLFEQHNKCFIAIPGERKEQQQSSLAIWFPDNPGGLFIFPDPVTINDAISDIKNMTQIEATDYVISKSFVLFGNHSFELAMIKSNSPGIRMFILVNNVDLSEKLLTTNHILGQIEDIKAQTEYITIKFDLDGFADALSAYHLFCKK